MTTPHDPLAVVAELAKALKGWTDYFDSLQRDAALVDPCDPLIAVRAQMHGKRMNDSLAALTRAAAMPEPAPEHQPYPHVGDNDSWTGPTAAMPAPQISPVPMSGFQLEWARAAAEQDAAMPAGEEGETANYSELVALAVAFHKEGGYLMADAGRRERYELKLAEVVRALAGKGRGE